MYCCRWDILHVPTISYTNVELNLRQPFPDFLTFIVHLKIQKRGAKKQSVEELYHNKYLTRGCRVVACFNKLLQCFQRNVRSSVDRNLTLITTAEDWLQDNLNYNFSQTFLQPSCLLLFLFYQKDWSCLKLWVQLK